jgi:hypothetical protein
MFLSYIEEGKDDIEISRIFNVEPRTVRTVASKLDVVIKRRHKSPRDLASIVSEKDFLSFFTGKETIYDAEEHFDIDHNTARSLARKYNCLSKIRKVTTKEAQQKIVQNSLKKYGLKYPWQNKKKYMEMRRKAHKTLKENGSNIKDWAATLLVNKTELESYLRSSGKKKTLVGIAEDTGYSPSAVSHAILRHDLKDFIEYNPKVGKLSLEVKDYLKSLGIKNIVENDRTIIHPKELDFYLPEYNIAIEFNGTYWHSIQSGIDKKYHQEKTLLAMDAGITLYQIFEFDWVDDTKKEIIKSQIANLLNKNNRKIYARECEIREVNYKDARDFINSNHLQGDGNLNRQINYGLYYNDELVYIMTFGKWRRGFKNKLEYEIFRSCSLKYTTVVGGASKLFKHFLKKYDNPPIGTYSSLQSGDGNLYKLLGFDFLRITEPSSVKVDRKNNVFTMFSKDYAIEDLLEVPTCGNKLWVMNISRK